MKILLEAVEHFETNMDVSKYAWMFIQDGSTGKRKRSHVGRGGPVLEKRRITHLSPVFTPSKGESQPFTADWSGTYLFSRNRSCFLCPATICFSPPCSTLSGPALPIKTRKRVIAAVKRAPIDLDFLWNRLLPCHRPG